MLGVVAVRVTASVPPDSTIVNGFTSLPYGCTVPVKVSTVGFVGDIGTDDPLVVGSLV